MAIKVPLFWEDYNKRVQEGKVVNQPSYVPQVTLNLPGWHPSVREWSTPPIQGKPYWTPKRIARYYNAVNSIPYGYNVPDWIDLPNLSAAYKYLSETRQDQWQNWEDSLDTDPALAEFVSTWAPPPIEAIPSWEKQQLEQEYQLQQQYQPGAVEPVGEWTKYGIADEATWNALPAWKQWANRIFKSREGMVAMGAAQFSAPFVLTGQPIGVAISAPLGAGFGYAMQQEGERAARLGTAYKPGFWYYVGGAFNFLYSQSQQALGLASQMINSIRDPEQYGDVDEILTNLPKAYESGEAFYALAAMKALADRAKAAEEGKPAGQYPALSKALEEAVARGEWEYTEEQKKLMREMEEHPGEIRVVNLTGEDVFIPMPKDRAVVAAELTNIRRMLIDGQLSSSQVRDYVFQKYGFTTELADLVGGLVLDPLNFMPNIEVPAIRAAAKATGNAPLQKAFTDVPDVQQGLWKYRQIIRTEMAPDDITKLSNLTRTFAGVTKEGLPVELRQPGELQGAPKIVDKMFGLTPEARAIEIQHQFIQGLAMLLETERGNPDGIMRLLNTFATMKPRDAVDAIQTGKIKVTVGGKLTEVDMPRWFLSAEGQSVPLMMKDLSGPIKDHYDAWRNSRPQAEWMQRIADGLEMDVYKLIAEVHEGRMTFDQIIKQLDELEAQGRQPARLLKQSLAKVRDLNNHALKQMADLFTGKDGLPFGADQWTVHLWNILAEGADNWAAKWFNIKPSGFARRWAQVIKQGMTMAVLGNNPTNLVNNALNNVITMMWEGLLSTATKKTRMTFMRRFGTSTKIHKAFNQAEIGIPEAERVQILGAKTEGYPVGRQVQAAKRNRDLAQMASDLLHKGDKFMLASVLNQKIERWCSEMATVKGIMEYMDRTWRAGVGYDRMPDDLRVVLDGVQPGLADRIETAIARGLNKQEIEAEIFNRLDVPKLRDVLTTDEIGTLDHFPGLVDEIDAGVRAAKTPEEVRAAFDSAIEKVNKEISADLQRKVAAIVHKYAAKVQIEGLQGAFDLMDQLVPERHDFWMEHMRKMDAAAQEAAKLTGLERANVWRQALEQADAEWRNFQQLEGAKWLGIVEGLGFEKMSPEYGQMTKNLEDVHDMWSNFYGLRRDLMDEYWGYIEATDFTGMSKAEAEALRSAKWAEINDRLNETYADYVVTEDAYQVAMDADLTRMYGERMGATSRSEAVRWRQTQLLTRRVMIEAQVMWRLGELPEGVTKALGNVLPKEIADKIRLLNNGEPIYRMPVGQRDAANQKFYRQIYQPLIGEMMQAATVGQKPKPKAPKGEAPKAEEPKPAEKPKAEKPTAKNPIEAEINRLMAEKKPEIKQVSEAGAPDKEYRLNTIKWLRKWSQAAKELNVKRWEDVTPALILEAYQSEQYFKAHQPKVLPEARPEEPEAPKAEETAPEITPEDADIRAALDEEARITEGLSPEAAAQVEAARRAEAAKEHVIRQAEAMRQNADEMLQLAPPKEVNAEIYREWLHNHFADRYPDKPQVAAERADTVFAVIDRIVESKARELGITKDEYYKNFVLTRGGEGMGGTALYRADPERFYASLDRLEYERYDDGIHYALYSKEGLEQAADLTYLEAKELLGEEITAHILAEAVAGIIKGDILRTIPEGSFKVMPSEGVGALTYWLRNGKAVIHAFRRADAPDMLHEFVHAITPLLPEGDLATIKNWYEAEYKRTLRDDWYTRADVDRDAFEKLARGFERYMTEGSTGLRGEIAAVMAKIKRWMLDIYRTITGSDIDIKLNDDIRAMFDRWLGEEPPKEFAEAIQNVENWLSEPGPFIEGARVIYHSPEEIQSSIQRRLPMPPGKEATIARVIDKGTLELAFDDGSTVTAKTHQLMPKAAEQPPVQPPAPDIWKKRARQDVEPEPISEPIEPSKPAVKLEYIGDHVYYKVEGSGELWRAPKDAEIVGGYPEGGTFIADAAMADEMLRISRREAAGTLGEPPKDWTQAKPERKEYYIVTTAYNAPNTFKLIENAKPLAIKGFEELDLFIHSGDDGWHVSDGKTGMLVARNKNKADLIKDVSNRLVEMGVEKYNDLVNRQLNKGDLSPRYKPKEATIEAATGRTTLYTGGDPIWYWNGVDYSAGSVSKIDWLRGDPVLVTGDAGPMWVAAEDVIPRSKSGIRTLPEPKAPGANVAAFTPAQKRELAGKVAAAGKQLAELSGGKMASEAKMREALNKLPYLDKITVRKTFAGWLVEGTGNLLEEVRTTVRDLSNKAHGEIPPVVIQQDEFMLILSSASQANYWHKTLTGKPIPGFEDIPTRGAVLYRRQPDAWYYSALVQLIEQKMPNKASAEQVRGMLRGSVKEDELRWTGFDDFLNEHKTFTKQEALDYLRENQVEVKEVVKGGVTKLWTQGEIDNLERQARRTGNWEAHERAVAEYEDQQLGSNANQTGNTTKFATYSLPGGENYRELLLTLPTKRTPVEGYDIWSEGRHIAGPFETREAAISEANRRGLDPRTDYNVAERGGHALVEQYKSAHWQEPNVLAHVRFNERVDADGKRVLFIEEIQSDWHQAGREKGYADPNAQKLIEEASNRAYEARQKYLSYGYGTPEYKKFYDEWVKLSEEHQKLIGIQEGVPAAPFSKNWEELTIKRMIRWAAENGFDRVAWTTGKMQADRYNLAKYIDKISYRKLEDGNIRYLATKGNQTVATGTEPPEKLRDIIGKEMTDKIVSSKDDAGEFRGIDLEVGGEGMKAFYDQKIPNIVKKYIKKWGGEVGETEINANRSTRIKKEPEGYYTAWLDGKQVGAAFGDRASARAALEEAGSKPSTVPSFDITPSMRSEAMSGQVLFRKQSPGEGEPPRYQKPTDPDGNDLPEPPVAGAPIGTGEELTGLPLEEITLEGWTKEIRPMLERARRAMLETPKLGIDAANDLPNEAQTRLRQYLGQVYSQLADTKIGAAKWGETRRQFALLDYTKTTGAEAATFSLLPYGFWYLHTALNWAARALNKPAIMANYFRLMRMQQRHTEGDGFPERLRYKTFIPMPFLPDWMGGGMWIDPYRQIFPFENITAPFRRASQEQNRENRRAEQILYDMVEAGEIGDEEAQAAIETREGPLWARAHSQALTEIEQDFQNPFDYVFALTSPLLPINWAYNALTGRADRIGQLPFTRLVQTMTAAAGIGGPRGVNLEAPIRRGLGLPEVDRFEDYRVERELSNMVAEGLIDPDTAITAMIDKTGEAFEEAQRRVSQQGLVKYAGAAIAADLMPEGEMIQRGLQQELAKAYDAKAAGDKDAVNKFYDKYPEYEARLAVFKDPQSKLRAFLISKIWDTYLNMPKAQKKVFREEAGDDFTELFLDEKTQSYNSITTDTLAMWAQSLVGKAGGTLPQTTGGAKMDVDWLADETAQAIQKYYDERDKLFGPYDPNEELDPKYSLWQNAYLAEHPAIIPYVIGEENKLQGLPLDIQTYVFRYRAERDARFPNIFDTQDKYFTLNKNERKAYLKQHPELPEYWDWRKQMAAAFPKAAAYIMSEESLAAEILDDDYVTYTSGGGGGYSGGGSGTPTYTSTGKPATGYHPPYLTSAELKQFSRALIMQLMAKFYRGEQLLPGAMLEITRIWEQSGKPFGTLDDFIEFAVKPTLTQ